MRRELISTFGPFLTRYRGRLVLAYAALLATTIGALLKPWPLKLILDHVLLDQPVTLAWLTWIETSDSIVVLTILSAAIVVIVIFESLFSYIARNSLAAVGQGLTNDVRVAAFDRIQRMSALSPASRTTGDVVLRMTSDIKAVRDLLVTHVQKFVSAGLALIGTVSVMFWMDWKLTLAALSVAPILFILSYHFSRHVREATKLRQNKEGNVASMVQETVTSLPVIQAFTQEPKEKARIAQESTRSMEASLESTRLGAGYNRLVRILNAVGTALVAWYGAVRALQGQLTPGDLLVFTAYIKDLYTPVENLSELVVTFAESTVSAHRVRELLHADSDIKEAKNAKRAPAFRGEVRFDNVSFSYEGKPVLHNLSFTVDSGRSVALVGSSGTGKSTIVNLLLRFIDPTEGRILIDGEDIRSFKLESLRKQITMVPQEPILFRRSIRENIAYGRPNCTLRELVTAARAVQAHDFIMEFPNGYDTVLDERGGNLSGGQKERIALARAVLRNAPIIILDEPGTGLDAITEAQVTENLASAFAGKTRFLIAHRFNTLVNSDLILVIEEGNIVEQGTHDELLNRSGLYRDFFAMQG